jgi:hypothetical protein
MKLHNGYPTTRAIADPTDLYARSQLYGATNHDN